MTEHLSFYLYVIAVSVILTCPFVAKSIFPTLNVIEVPSTKTIEPDEIFVLLYINTPLLKEVFLMNSIN